MITPNQPARTFGAFLSGAAASAATPAATTERPKAQLWLNVGYVAGEGENAKFVSLPVGIALDTMEKAANVRSADFNNFRTAQNALLDNLIAEGMKLQPGCDIVIDAGGGLSLQLRRVNDAPTQAATDESNPYARQFAFAVSPNTETSVIG